MCNVTYSLASSRSRTDLELSRKLFGLNYMCDVTQPYVQCDLLAREFAF